MEVSGRQAAGVELEALYLTGPFAVPAERATEPVARKGQQFVGWRVAARLEPERAAQTYEAGADLAGQGFPHFAGELRLAQEVELERLALGERAILELDAVHAATALVEVNGRAAGQTLWPPYAVEVTDALRPGTNHIAVRLVTSLRNLLGPLHAAGGDHTSVGPGTFRDAARWTEDCWLVPLGLAPARLIIGGGAAEGATG